MSELEIMRRGWRVTCGRPTVNNPAAMFVAKVFEGHDAESRQIGLGMSARSMDAAVAEAYRSACETGTDRLGPPGER